MSEIHSMADKQASAQLFTLDDLLRTLDEWRSQRLDMPAQLRLSPALYRKLAELCSVPATSTAATFYGIPLLVDPKLKHGEYVFDPLAEDELSKHLFSDD